MKGHCDEFKCKEAASAQLDTEIKNIQEAYMQAMNHLVCEKLEQRPPKSRT